MENQVLWDKCLGKLEDEIDEHDFNMWVRPLSAINDESTFRLHAPNRFVRDWLSDNLLDRLSTTVQHFSGEDKTITIELDTSAQNGAAMGNNSSREEREPALATPFGTNVLNSSFTFENHIEGKSNQIARAAAKQVSENPGSA